MAGDIVMTKRGGLSVLFGAVDLVSAVVIYTAVFQGLPTRYWLIDGGAAIVCLLFASAGAGLLTKARWAELAATVASCVSLVLGLLLVSTLALTASYLAGIYGAIGRGGSIILSLAAALTFPYLVALPLAQLAWLYRGRPQKTAAQTLPSRESASVAVADS
jgi:hypothetical protein